MDLKLSKDEILSML